MNGRGLTIHSIVPIKVGRRVLVGLAKPRLQVIPVPGIAAVAGGVLLLLLYGSRSDGIEDRGGARVTLLHGGSGGRGFVGRCASRARRRAAAREPAPERGRRTRLSSWVRARPQLGASSSGISHLNSNFSRACCLQCRMYCAASMPRRTGDSREFRWRPLLEGCRLASGGLGFDPPSGWTPPFLVGSGFGFRILGPARDLDLVVEKVANRAF